MVEICRVTATFLKRFSSSSLWFIAATLVALTAFFWLYLVHLFIVKDVNPEAMDIPLTVAYLELARDQGIPLDTYFQDNTLWGNLKQQNPKGAYTDYSGRFQFEFFALQAPLLSILYLPFIKLLGVSSKTVAIYSTFFSVTALITSIILAWKAFGQWCALLSLFLMLSSLSWLIHTKIGYAAWMPSVTLINILALCLYSYMQNGRREILIVTGCLLGLMYLAGWIIIIFGILLVGLVLLLKNLQRILHLLLDLEVIALSFLGTVVVFTLGYAFYYHCNVWDIHSAILDAMFGRFSQGEPGLLQLSLGQKIGYAFKCMCLDSRTLDPHADKFLEGRPAIPYLFTLCFLIGLFYAIKNRSPADKLLLLWVLSIFGFIGSAFIFSHRYALLAMPAMGILAAQGVIAFGNNLARWNKKLIPAYYLLVGFGILFALQSTHYDYYVTYTLHKEPNLESDNKRGHAEIATWLKKTCSPHHTLVVLGDPTMFSHTAFLFNTFGYDYRFVYWMNYFGSQSTSQQITAWEKKIFKQYPKIVYLFSNQFLGDPTTNTVINDWRPFAIAHPGIKPHLTYSYSDRPPSIFVYEIVTQPSHRK